MIFMGGLDMALLFQIKPISFTASLVKWPFDNLTDFALLLAAVLNDSIMSLT